MARLEKLDVHLQFCDTPMAMDEMIFDKGKTYFGYHPS